MCELTRSTVTGAGSLLLEFITLSRLTGDPTFETLARRAFFAIWNRKSEIGLIGNTIDVRTGMWMHGVAGIGAGIDSFYESVPVAREDSDGEISNTLAPLASCRYAAKAYVLTGEDDYLRVWEEGYAALQRYVRSQDGFWVRVTPLPGFSQTRRRSLTPRAVRAVPRRQYGLGPTRRYCR